MNSIATGSTIEILYLHEWFLNDGGVGVFIIEGYKDSVGRISHEDIQLPSFGNRFVQTAAEI